MAALLVALLVQAAAQQGAWAASRALHSVTTSAQLAQISIAYNRPYGKGSEPIPLTDPRLAPSDAPWEQVHLTYVGEDSLVVSWVTKSADGNLASTNDTSTSPFGPLSTVTVTPDSEENFPVFFGLDATKISDVATGNTSTYRQIYTGFRNNSGFTNDNPIINYTSPTIHHVQLIGLLPNATYYYQVTGNGNVRSKTFNFTTPAATGMFPLRLGVFADVGQTYNSSMTLERMLGQAPDIATLVGDWTYADEYLTNGTTVMEGFLRNENRANLSNPTGSDQCRWDSWFRLAEPLLSHIPIIPNAGNHEIEPQGDGSYFNSTAWGLDDGRQFNSYLARVPVTPLFEQSGGGPLYYTTTVGPVQMIVLSNYEDFQTNSSQFAWLQETLAKIDRTVTPWVVAQWHSPWYASYSSHYKEGETMRVTIEPLLYAAGVDIVLTGHIHAYERTHAMYNYQKTPCGTVHITMGDGGNVEGLDTTFVDQLPDKNCFRPGKRPLPFYQPGAVTPSFVYDLKNKYKGLCPDRQPEWSAFRQPAFGLGMLTFINITHARWQWTRNLDFEIEIVDSIYIVRNMSCPNAFGNAPALAPLLAPAADGLPLPMVVTPGLAEPPILGSPSSKVTPGPGPAQSP